MLTDVREPDEHARERIPNAKLVPLSRLTAPLDRHEAQQMTFHCRSGSRTSAAAEQLAVAAGGDPHVLRGELNAWKAAGLPVLKDTRRPIEMMRQVQIAAGSLVVLGVGLGALLHPGFYALSGFVGAGLVFAGTCRICPNSRVCSVEPNGSGVTGSVADP